MNTLNFKCGVSSMLQINHIILIFGRILKSDWSEIDLFLSNSNSKVIEIIEIIEMSS